MKKKLSLHERLTEKTEVDAETECWNWIGCLTESGYGQIHCLGKTHRAHRVSYMVHLGPIPEGAVILHSCDNRRCINPDHLTAGTQSDNMRDALKKGRLKVPPARKGQEHPNSFVTDRDVVRLRKEYQKGRKLSSIHKEVGLALSTVKRMLWGRTYSHLPVFNRKDAYMNNRKLTEEQRKAVIEDPRSGAAIGRDYGVSQSLVTFIKRGIR